MLGNAKVLAGVGAIAGALVAVLAAVLGLGTEAVFVAGFAVAVLLGVLWARPEISDQRNQRAREERRPSTEGEQRAPSARSNDESVDLHGDA
jgi:O-antigen/teichoic acid export membrane protein